MPGFHLAQFTEEAGNERTRLMLFVGGNILGAGSMRHRERRASDLLRCDLVLGFSGRLGCGGTRKKVMVKTQHLGLCGAGQSAACVCAFNATRKMILATRADVARNYADRATGLLGRESFEIGEGLHIVPSDSIHTVGMRFPIDVLFLDENGIVIDRWLDIQPGRTGIKCYRAASTLEIPCGVANATGTRTGDKIDFSEAAC